MTKRRLILCMDGTWNSNDKSDKVTNIVKLLRAIPAVDAQGVSQVLYYGRGVGTGKGEKIRGGFSGAGLDDNIIDGYRFLGNNYHPGMDGLIRNRFKPENSRRNLPPKNEETVNEYLHISALQRWQLPEVAHDLAEDKDAPLQPYRPANLSALIQHAQDNPGAMPVIGWDGEPLSFKWGQINVKTNSDLTPFKVSREAQGRKRSVGISMGPNRLRAVSC